MGALVSPPTGFRYLRLRFRGGAAPHIAALDGVVWQDWVPRVRDEQPLTVTLHAPRPGSAADRSPAGL